AYASFFNRVSDAIRRQWHPNDVLRRRRDSEQEIAGKSRQTTVELMLNRRGEVVKALVHTYSGADVLDDEALRAVRAAGPFPNPPDGLFDPGVDVFTFRFGFRVTFEHQRN